MGGFGLNIRFRGEVVQRGMRSNLVVDPFSFFKDLIEGWQSPILAIRLVELFRICAMGAFHLRIMIK